MFLYNTTSKNQNCEGIFALLAAFLCLSTNCSSHMFETMSSVLSMEGQTIHSSSASGGSAWHFKAAAMLAMVTSTSLSLMEEKRTPGRLQSYFKFS
jgi:hypothetical protein